MIKDKTKSNRTWVFYPKTETLLSDEELAKLKLRYKYFNAKVELPKICKYVFNLKVIKFSKIEAWGLDHLLFKVTLENNKSYLVRINNTTVGDDYFEVEALIYKVLKQHDIQSCNVYHVEKRSFGNFPYDFMIIDFLEKADFEKLLELGKYTKEQELSLVYKIGQFIRRVHSIKTKGFGFFNVEEARKGKLIGELSSWQDYFFTAVDSNLKQIVDLGYLNISIANTIEKLLEKHDYFLQEIEPVLLHGDFCDHNIIVNGKKVVGIIDLKDAMSGDFLHDIAFWLSFYTFDRLNYLLAGYFDNTSTIDYQYITAKLYYYLLRINLSKVVLRHKYGVKQKIPLGVQKIKESISYLQKI